MTKEEEVQALREENRATERDEWAARYFEILAAGYAAQLPPLASCAGPRKGRRKQSKAKNLLDALLGRADQVLALLADLRIPFTNNQAERDLRWAKVQQKISGTFRSATRVTAFAASAVIFRRCSTFTSRLGN